MSRRVNPTRGVSTGLPTIQKSGIENAPLDYDREYIEAFKATDSILNERIGSDKTLDQHIQTETRIKPATRKGGKRTKKYNNRRTRKNRNKKSRGSK